MLRNFDRERLIAVWNCERIVDARQLTVFKTDINNGAHDLRYNAHIGFFF